MISIVSQYVEYKPSTCTVKPLTRVASIWPCLLAICSPSSSCVPVMTIFLSFNFFLFENSEIAYKNRLEKRMKFNRDIKEL